ncbi:hypothetical protein GCM10027443_10080 [Pontibacter brevis]
MYTTMYHAPSKGGNQSNVKKVKESQYKKTETAEKTVITCSNLSEGMRASSLE